MRIAAGGSLIVGAREVVGESDTLLRYCRCGAGERGEVGAPDGSGEPPKSYTVVVMVLV